MYHQESADIEPDLVLCNVQTPLSRSRLVSCDRHTHDYLASNIYHGVIFGCQYGQSGFIHPSRDYDKQTFQSCSHPRASIPYHKDSSWWRKDTFWSDWRCHKLLALCKELHLYLGEARGWALWKLCEAQQLQWNDRHGP